MHNQLSSRLRDSTACRFVLWTGLAVVIWIFPSKGVQDALIYCSFLFALFKASRGVSVWKQPAGIAFIIVLIYTIIRLPFSLSPYVSAREFAKFLQIIAGAFAIPVIFNTSGKIQSALFYSAVAITLTLLYDILRLSYHLGPDLIAGAHAFEPFILNHSNVSSMMAGASCFLFFYFLWTWRRRPAAAIACSAGILVCVAYLVILASRGPQLAFAGACCCAGFLIPGRRGKLIWIACVAIAAGALFANIHRVNPRFLEKETMENLSDRDKVWSHTWRLISERPWLGHGYGKRNFVAIYYSTDPPQARFEFPHPHQFWLKILFESGWIGFALHLAAWLILARALMRSVLSAGTFQERLLPGTVGLILLMIHLYGLGEYPDHVVRMAQFWLIPVALALTNDNTGKGAG